MNIFAESCATIPQHCLICHVEYDVVAARLFFLHAYASGQRRFITPGVSPELQAISPPYAALRLIIGEARRRHARVDYCQPSPYHAMPSYFLIALRLPIPPAACHAISPAFAFDFRRHTPRHAASSHFAAERLPPSFRFLRRCHALLLREPCRRRFAARAAIAATSAKAIIVHICLSLLFDMLFRLMATPIGVDKFIRWRDAARCFMSCFRRDHFFAACRATLFCRDCLRASLKRHYTDTFARHLPPDGFRLSWRLRCATPPYERHQDSATPLLVRVSLPRRRYGYAAISWFNAHIAATPRH